MSNSDDLELLAQYTGEGSDAAFTALAERHVNLVYSAALRQVRDPHLAEEVTQVVFVLLARKARTFRRGLILSAWLLRSTRFTSTNLLVAQYRRVKREQEAVQMQTASANEPDWSQIAPFLDEALAELGEKDRSVLALRFFEQKPLADIGAALGIEADTARKRVTRAVEKLRGSFLKRGVTLSAVALGAALSAHAVQAAPAGLVASVATAAAIKGAAASASTATLLKTTLKLMAWTKTKIAAIAGLGLLLAAGVTTVTVEIVRHSGEPPEPVYNGKSLTYWVNQFAQPLSQTNRAANSEAKSAIEQIGTNGFPTLLRMLRAHDSPLEGKLLTWATHWHLPGVHYQSSDSQNNRACMAFAMLGPRAAEAVPDLVKMFNENLSHDSELWTATTLGYLGSNALPAIPSLVRAASGADEYRRNHALFALARIPADANEVVPVLTAALRDPWANNRANAAFALASYHSDAKSAVPALVALLNDPNVNSSSAPTTFKFPVDVRSQVEKALRQIDPEAYARVVTNAAPSAPK